MKKSLILIILFFYSISYSQSNSYFVNQGNAKIEKLDFNGAIVDYTKAIELEPKDCKAYYKRGISHISLNNKNKGCLDLSKAGELGCEEAYKSIQENCN